MSETEKKDKIKKLIILVNEPRSVELPAGESELPEESRGLLLLPGENAVTEAYWNNVKGNPGVKIYLSGGVIENKGTGEARPLNKSLDSLSAKEAQIRISKIDEVRILQNVKENTKKQAILRLINKRITDLVESEKGDVK